MNLETLNWLKKNFQRETGLELYQAMMKFYNEYPLENWFYSDDDVLSMDEATVKDTAELVKQAVLKSVRKNVTNTKQKNDWYLMSFARSLGWRLTPNIFHNKWEKLFKATYDAIIDNLVANPRIAFNPVVLLSGQDVEKCRCIFEPNKNLFKRCKSFLSKDYSGNSHIVTGYSIDIQALKDAFNVSIEKDDIESLYYPMYDIDTRGAIAQGDWQSLISMWQILNDNKERNDR